MPLRMKPTYIVERVTDINLDDLKAQNIKGLIFDLDNTIMPPKTQIYPEDIFQWLENAKSDFKIAILSNNPDSVYVKKAGEKLGCVAFNKAGKPRRKAAVEAINKLGLKTSEVAMVGDRPLTDICVGQRLGITTILVDPLMKHQEPKPIQFLRKLERMFVSYAQKTFSE